MRRRTRRLPLRDPDGASAAPIGRGRNDRDATLWLTSPGGHVASGGGECCYSINPKLISVASRCLVPGVASALARRVQSFCTRFATAFAHSLAHVAQPDV